MTGRPITVSAAARVLGVDPSTVRRWCVAGRVPGAYTTPGGHWRLPARWARETATWTAVEPARAPVVETRASRAR